MKFGKRFEEEKIQLWYQGYVDYAYLKQKIKEVQQKKGDEVAPPTGSVTNKTHPTFQASTSFQDAIKEWSLILEAERNKVDRFCAAKADEILLALSLMTRQCATAGAADIAKLEAEADEAAADVVNLDMFIKLNGLAFEKIYKKADKQLGMSTRLFLLGRLETTSFLNTNLNGFLVTLSDVYSRIRALREGNPAAAAGGVWTPPESFERSTTKFWVRLSDVTRLKTLIIKHMPVLVFGRDTSSFKAVNPLEAHHISEATDSGYITSVYLDSDDMSCYHDRIKRLEGARLFRIRWYGGDAQPYSKSEIFVERKTHHECWVDETSVKERFSIKASKAANFLTGEYEIGSALQRRMEDGDMTAPAVEKIRTLAVTTQEEIVKRKLTAKVRTRYRRTAFQSATNNAVRISLDTELQMIREGPDEAHPFKPGQWCNDAAMMGRSGGVLNFPYAVLEIKLQEAPPAWVHGLLSQGLATAVWKYSKFLTGACVSFPHAVRFVPHWFTTEGLLMEPSGYTEAAIESLRVCRLLREKDEEALRASATAGVGGAVRHEGGGAASGGASRASPAPTSAMTGGGRGTPSTLGSLWPTSAPAAMFGGAAGGAASEQHPMADIARPTASLARAGGTGISDGGAQPRAGPQPRGLLAGLPTSGGGQRVAIPGMNPHHTTNGAQPANATHQGAQPAQGAFAAASRQHEQRLAFASSSSQSLPSTGPAAGVAAGSAHSTGGAGSEKVSGGARSTAYQPLDDDGWGASVPPATRTPIPGHSSGAGLHLRAALTAWLQELMTPGTAPQKARMVPVRVEPKVYFAAERTFLQWLSSSLFLVTLTVGLLAMGTAASRTMAYILYPISISLICYALYQYFSRVRKLDRKDANGYHDARGPIALGIILIVALVAVLIFNITAQTSTAESVRASATTPSSSRRLRDRFVHGATREDFGFGSKIVSASSFKLLASSAGLTTRSSANAASFPSHFEPFSFVGAPQAYPGRLITLSASSDVYTSIPYQVTNEAVAVVSGDAAVAACELSSLPASQVSAAITRIGGGSKFAPDSIFLNLFQDGSMSLATTIATSAGNERVLQQRTSIPVEFKNPFASTSSGPQQPIALAAVAAPADAAELFAGSSQTAVYGMSLACRAGAEDCSPQAKAHFVADLDALLPEADDSTGTVISGIAFGSLPQSLVQSAPPSSKHALFVAFSRANIVRAYSWPDMVPIQGASWQLPPPPRCDERAESFCVWRGIHVHESILYLASREGVWTLDLQ